ncbi:MAG: threonine/serine exporter family protein [Deltaproteobacteria bacterium]|nr:threonine/serine exporter family protein [Deltaproteobacteria bacterium]
MRISNPPSGDVEDPRLVFVLDLTRALHAYGMPADRLETMLEAMSERLDLPVQAFTTPTVIIASFGEPPRQRTVMITPRQKELDLSRLAELDELVQEVADGSVTPKEGSERVSAIVGRKPLYPTAVRMAAHSGVAFAIAFLLGGNQTTAILAALAGLAVGLLEIFSERSAPLLGLTLPLGALIAAGGGVLGTLIDPSVAVAVVSVAGIIMLVPGLTLTTAMNEIATGHLVSGTARLSKALVAFLMLGFGAALGGELAGLVPGVGIGIPVTDPPGLWVTLASLVGSVIALTILLEARPRDFGWIALASSVAYGMGLLGLKLAGPDVGAGVATLGLGLVGNAFARFRNRPAALLIVPGILLLVPGSLGFRAVTSFLDENLLVAISTAFDVAIVAISLVAGLMIANLALPPRKAL